MSRYLLPFGGLVAFLFITYPVCSYQPPPDAWRYDANGDGRISAEDIFTLLLIWGMEGIPTPTPVITVTPTLSLTPTESETPTQTLSSTPTVTPCTSSEVITIAIPGLPQNARPLRFIGLPAGSFQMGNNGETDDQYCSCSYCECEDPRHEVTFGCGFFIGETEVTQAQWTAVMGINPATSTGYDPYGVGPDYPVYYISWDDCQAFISELQTKTESQFRLPSESEWEYACRGSSSNGNRYESFSFGNDMSMSDPYGCDFSTLFDTYMWWCGNTSSSITSQPVAAKLPNDYGLYDMHGNVWEWCEDIWHPNYSDAPTDGTAWTWDTGGIFERVVRGGGWHYNPRTCRSAYRTHHKPSDQLEYLGLRLVLIHE